jgi:hypothetical protein
LHPRVYTNRFNNSCYICIYVQIKIHQKDKKVKVNAKLSLCLTKHYAMKAYWGSGGIAPLIL